MATYSKGLESNGSHVLDLLFFLAGDETAYQVASATEAPDRANPSFRLLFDNGLCACIEGMELPYHCIDIAAVCEKGRLAVLHGGMTPVVEERVEHELFPGFYRLAPAEQNLLGRGGFGVCMQRALEDLIASFEEGCEPRSNLRSARKVQDVIEAVRMQRTEAL
jgi:hypothetical protein